MLSGPWPRVTGDRSDADVDWDDRVREVVGTQIEAGMGFVTDGHVRWADPAAAILAALEAGDAGHDGLLLRAWRATSAAASATGAGIPAAQALPGPYTLGLRGCSGLPATGEEREERTLSLAGALASELAALAAAGCPVVIVHEPAAVDIRADSPERALFAAAQQRLLADVEAFPDLHAMLAITGGSAAEAGAAAIFAAPYRSYLFDLVAGPDNWYLVRAAPPERGIVCGAMRVETTGGENQLPLLVWAARYAASAGGRGLDRVGLANATPLGGLDQAAARAALLTLGRAADLAAMPLERAVEAGLDPRTIGSRTAAPGSERTVPAPPAKRPRATLSRIHPSRASSPHDSTPRPLPHEVSP